MVRGAGYIKLQNNQALKLNNMHLEIEKIEKEAFRSLWISRINAGAREIGVSYSVLMKNG